MNKEDEEYKKLYSLLSSLSSKNAPPTDHMITPVISLMTEKQTSRTLTLDIPPLETPNVKKQIAEKQIVEKPVVVEPPVEKPVLSPLEEIMTKSSARSRTTFTCEACLRVFPTSSNLLTHHKITPMCAQWFSLPNKEEYEHNPISIHVFMDEILGETVAVDGSPNECRFCHSTFSNKGNLHKHFHTSIVCNRMAYARFKKVVANLK
jgi:hypothetical protein